MNYLLSVQSGCRVKMLIKLHGQANPLQTGVSRSQYGYTDKSVYTSTHLKINEDNLRHFTVLLSFNYSS